MQSNNSRMGSAGGGVGTADGGSYSRRLTGDGAFSGGRRRTTRVTGTAVAAAAGGGAGGGGNSNNNEGGNNSYSVSVSRASVGSVTPPIGTTSNVSGLPVPEFASQLGYGQQVGCLVVLLLSYDAALLHNKACCCMCRWLVIYLC